MADRSESLSRAGQLELGQRVAQLVALAEEDPVLADPVYPFHRSLLRPRIHVQLDGANPALVHYAVLGSRRNDG